MMCMFFYVPSYAAILSVDNDGPADYTTIQNAIQAAQDGDIVSVAPGTYYENVYFHGKAITLTSQNPDDPDIVAQTIIDGNNWDSVITFAGGEGADSIITGFTITGGSSLYGSGICCWQSSPVISKNNIMGNRSYENYAEGAGIYCYLSEAVIRSNFIRWNSLEGDMVAGAGISVIESSPIISDNIIANNRTVSWDYSEGIQIGYGGGVYCESSQINLMNNIIFDNESVFGGGIYLTNTDGIVNGNTIKYNRVEIYSYDEITPGSYYADGAGIYITDSGHTQDLTLENNKIISNWCYNYWHSPGAGLLFISRGAGVFCSASYVNLIGNDIKNNRIEMFHENENSSLLVGGGGIYYDSCQGNIKGNIVTGNTVFARGNPVQPVGGGGIYLDNSLNIPCDLSILNNIIVSNMTYADSYESLEESKGGGIFCNSYLSPTIDLNTIVANRADGGKGGGIYFAEDSSPYINNNIIVKNTGGGGIFWKYAVPSSFSFNCLWGNIGGDYSGWASPGDGDISADPLFANALEQDYHLKSQEGRWDADAQAWVFDDVTSPCINAGDGLYKNEPKPNGKRINIGAYGGTEQASKSDDVPVVYCTQDLDGDVNGDCKVDSGDLQVTAYNWLDTIAPVSGMKEDLFRADVGGFEILTDDEGYLYIMDQYGVGKYEPNGLNIWEHDDYFYSSYNGPSEKMVLDSVGNLYCRGNYLIKLDKDGNLLWSVDYGYSNDEIIVVDCYDNIYLTSPWSWNYPIEVAVKYDPNGTKLITVEYYDSKYENVSQNATAVDTFGNSYLSFEVWENPDSKLFGIVKFDSDGNQLWSKEEAVNVQSRFFGHFLFIDNNSNIYLAYIEESFGDYTQVVRKYDSLGTVLWEKEHASVFFYELMGFDVDTAGNVYLAGHGSHDDLLIDAIIKYDPDGEELWTVRYYGNPDNYGSPNNRMVDAAIDDSGNVFITSFTYEWHGSQFPYSVSVFNILMYDAQGRQIWKASFPADSYQVGMTLTDEGDIYAVGGYDEYEENFLVKYSPAEICSGEVPYDSNSDCVINIEDYAIIAMNWLNCNLEPQQACWQ